MAGAEDVAPPRHADGSALSAVETARWRELRALVFAPDAGGGGDAGAALLGEPWARTFASAVCLRRYLVANAWDVREALSELRSTVAWRREQRLDTLRIADFPDCTAARYLEWNGRDADGRPVMYIRSRRAVLDIPRPRRLRFLLLMLERGMQLMEGQEGLGSEQWVLIIDERGKRWRHMDNTLLAQVGPLMYHHFVERLHRAYVIDGSILFRACFRLVSAWIDDRTRAKLQSIRPRAASGGSDAVHHDAEAAPSRWQQLRGAVAGAGGAAASVAGSLFGGSATPAADGGSDDDAGSDASSQSDGGPDADSWPCSVPALLRDIGAARLHVEYGGEVPEVDWAAEAARLDALPQYIGMATAAAAAEAPAPGG